jgi:hypothetical protein
MAFSALRSEIEANRKTTIDYATTLLNTKEQLKEIATLKGFAFADDKFIKQITSFTKATGLNISEADDFQKQLYGSAAGGLQKGFVTDEILEKTAILTGRTAKRQTKDLGTRGDLVGMLGQAKDYTKGADGRLLAADESAQSIAADAEAVRLALTEGRGDDAPLTKALLNVAGSMTGEGRPIKDFPETAALIGTVSLTAGPGQADTRSQQLIRGLRGSTPKQMSFLKEFAGIDEHDSLEKRLDKIVPKLKDEQAKGRDLGTFLTENDMNDEQTIAISEMVGNYDIFKKRLANARNPVSGKQIAADNQAFAISPAGRKAFGEAELQAAELAKGKKREALESALPGAKAQLVEEGMGTDLSYAPGNFVRWVGSGFTVPGEQSRTFENNREDNSIKQNSPDPRWTLGCGPDRWPHRVASPPPQRIMPSS